MKTIGNKVHFSAKVAGSFVAWDAEYPCPPTIQDVERTRLELEEMVNTRKGNTGPVVLARLDMVPVVTEERPEVA